MHFFKLLLNILLSMSILITIACDQTEQKTTAPVYTKTKSLDEKPNYRLAVHPLHNPHKLSQAYQPLIDYMNKHITEVKFKLEASRDYQAYEVKFRNRIPEIILPNPWQSLEAMKVGYHVIAMAGDARDFKGIFLVRKDSTIKTPQDLKGKVVSYPSHTALAACIMPQRYLHDNGVNIKKDIENRYVGSQESSIINVLLGDVAVGATWPPPWRLFQKDRPEEAAKLKVIWETPPLMNNSIMVRDDIDEKITKKISQLIYSLHESDNGRKILKGMETAQFFPANDESYSPVREFVADFEMDVRAVEQP